MARSLLGKNEWAELCRGRLGRFYAWDIGGKGYEGAAKNDLSDSMRAHIVARIMQGVGV